MATKCMIEGREIAESGGKGKRPDCLIDVACVSQHAMNATEALAKHEFGQCCALAFEKLVNIARRNEVSKSRGKRAQITVRQFFYDLRFYRAKAGSTNSPASRN